MMAKACLLFLVESYLKNCQLHESTKALPLPLSLSLVVKIVKGCQEKEKWVDAVKELISKILKRFSHRPKLPAS